MKRSLIGSAILALALAAPSFADSRLSIGLDIGSAPPPPRIEFRGSPHMRYVDRYKVYVIDDDRFGSDFFRYGNRYYVYNDGYWYRAARARGPFSVIRADYVPRVIFAVSSNDSYRWRQRPAWTPNYLDRDVRHDRGDRGRHNGHGRYGR